MLFISSQIALDPVSMKLNNETIEEETNQNVKPKTYIERSKNGF